jgi:hypothetical protein
MSDGTGAAGVECLQPCGDPTTPPRSAQKRRVRQSDQRARRSLPRPHPQQRRIVIERIEVAQIVETEPQPA